MAACAAREVTSRTTALAAEHRPAAAGDPMVFTTAQTAEAKMIWAFIAGFLTRALLSYVADRWRRWKVAREMHRVLAQYPTTTVRKGTIMRWKIKLWGITWDDDKGENDVSELPQNLEVLVTAEEEAEAIQHAMSDASDDYGSLISGVQRAEVTVVPDRRTRRDDID
jgi:hypothetical protein